MNQPNNNIDVLINSTNWSIDIVSTQSMLRDKSKIASKRQMEYLLNEFLAGIIKSHLTGDSSLTIISELINNWHPTEIIDIRDKYSTRIEENSEIDRKIFKQIGYNCVVEYNDFNDNINESKQSNILERNKMIPIPIKLYMSIFGFLSVALFALFIYQLLYNFLWNPYYTFLGLLSSIGLFFTARIALKDWSKIGENNCPTEKK